MKGKDAKLQILKRKPFRSDGWAAVCGREATVNRLEVQTGEQEEWIGLVAKAKEIGISIQEIRSFLKTATQSNDQQQGKESIS